MSGLPAQGIFLSYRREDAGPYARLLQFQLRERLPDAHVFMDLDSIEPGLDFAEVIQEAVDSCLVLVALIGRQWATIPDEEGNRRLDNPDDYVRFEVQAALERDVRVIPVLVDGAKSLRPQQLPPELRKLARLNAIELSYGRYEYDADRLLSLLERVLAAADTGTAPQSPPGSDVPAVVGSGDVPADRNAHVADAERPAQPSPGASLAASAFGGIAESRTATDPDHVARLFADAERSARSITDPSWEASAFASIARALVATDPYRAARLFDDAERIAQSILTLRFNRRGRAFASLAVALPATDPDRAERVAQSITNDFWKAWALAGVAGALAATDPARAARLIADAERSAHSVTSDSSKAIAFAAIAGALAATDPDRAERAAQSIADESSKAIAFASLAGDLAPTDPARAARLIADAERVAQSITSGNAWKARALASIAVALAATDPDRAEETGQSITDDFWKARALAGIAKAQAATDPDRAERTARSITSDYEKACALAGIAGVLAAADRDR